MFFGSAFKLLKSKLAIHLKHGEYNIISKHHSVVKTPFNSYLLLVLSYYTNLNCEFIEKNLLLLY